MFISERKQLGTIYHFTKITSVKSILETNSFKGSEIGTWNYERDFQFFKKDEKFFKEKNITHLYFFSTTRNKLLYKQPSFGIGGMTARIVLDGDKLSDKYRFVPFKYYEDEPKDQGSDESEERIILGLKKEIPNAKNYIKEIHIMLDVIEDNEVYLQEAEKLHDYDPSLIKLYYKEKEITMEDYRNNILPTIEPYREEMEEEGSFKYRGGPLLHEGFAPQKAPLIDKFVNYTCDRLNIDKPKIFIINSPTYSQEYKSFGGYYPQEQEIKIVVHNRNMADILRTLAHELVHHMQNLNGKELNGEDGSDTENEANAMAGVIMREFGRENPQIFESKLNKIKGEIYCTNCPWHWPLAKGGNDPYVCHKCGHNNMKKVI
jgi:hypothetical protein